MNGEVNPHQRMVYNWPLKNSEIDARLDSKTYKTCKTKVKRNKTYNRLKY